MGSEVRFCRAADGVRIAYSVEGEGPDLLMCSGRGESFSVSHLSPELTAFGASLGAGRRLIRFDERGTGLSNRDAADRSHAALASDLAAVMDHAGVTRGAIFASCLSGPRAIAYAAANPDRVSHLVLVNTTPDPMNTIEQSARDAYASLARIDWRMWSRQFVELGASRKYPEAVDGMAEMMFQSVTGDSAARQLVEGSIDSDVTAEAKSLPMPVLVAHGTDDLVIFQKFGYDLASLIPNVRFVSLTGGVSLHFLGDTAPLLAAIADFLPAARGSGARAPAKEGSSVQTVLFTDLVGHTEMMRRLGDDRGRAVLREHERITRETLRAHAGAEVKTMGDGFMASFGSVTRAMDCAIALQRAFAAHSETMPEPLHVRVGLNAGEPIEEDGDLFGSTVILASRIAAQAGAGEILIPEPLRHLLTGKSYVYADRGDTMLKGFEDAVRLYEVRWRE